jgi:hypothetical protein
MLAYHFIRLTEAQWHDWWTVKMVLTSKARFLVGVCSLITVIGASSNVLVRGDAPERGNGLQLRLVHPDRQAARVSMLFEGARSPHPAAALAAWKRATRDPNQLGKPLEAVISFFNPAMTPEWLVMDGAQIGFDLSAADGRPRWFAIVPRDDGTLSAAITAQRLTDGSRDLPLTVEGRRIDVERLGRAGAVVAARSGETLILGTSREELMRGLRRIGSGITPAVPKDAEFVIPGAVAPMAPQFPFDSGLVFDLEPGLISAAVGSITYRRAVAFLQGLGCRRIHGNLGLTGDVVAIEVTTMLQRGALAKPALSKPSVAVDPAWLEWIPAAGAMAVLSVALGPGEPFWESAFALADRVDRADPARAALAPLRARFNLVAAAAGARPESDLWPHLRGVTAGVMGDPDRPGRPNGVVVVLHADADANAHRLATDVLPRLASLLAAQKQGEVSRQGFRPSPVGDAQLIAKLGGRPLMISRRSRDVVISWGDEMQKALEDAVAHPGRSVALLCNGWIRAGKKPPQRVGAVWPTRCWPVFRGLDPTTPAWQTLAQGPPTVWWGWNDLNTAHDSIFAGDLRHRVRDFLEELPLDPSLLK